MIPFPAVFALGNTWVHVGTMDSGNKTSNIEPSIDNALYFHAALCIPYVNPNDGHIGFRRYLNYSWF